MRPFLTTTLAVATMAAALSPLTVLAEEAGVRLSPRERAAVVERYVLPDGRVVLLTENNGLPFLFGLGDATGKPSSVPLVNGITPSVMASTPSGGLVPGQSSE